MAASKKFDRPIATEILPATDFYAAEDYHQDYHKKNPLRYALYRQGSGRQTFLDRTWGAGDAPSQAAPTPVPKPNVDQAALKKRLTSIQYHVTRNAGPNPRSTMPIGTTMRKASTWTS